MDNSSNKWESLANPSPRSSQSRRRYQHMKAKRREKFSMPFVNNNKAQQSRLDAIQEDWQRRLIRRGEKSSSPRKRLQREEISIRRTWSLRCRDKKARSQNSIMRRERWRSLTEFRLRSHLASLGSELWFDLASRSPLAFFSHFALPHHLTRVFVCVCECCKRLIGSMKVKSTMGFVFLPLHGVDCSWSTL